MADPEWGISAEDGWYTPSLSDVIEDCQDDLRAKFGGDLNVGDNSRAGMLAKVQAGREYKVWQQMGAVYASQTKNGAEGEFMDEMYAYQGITRNGQTYGTGTCVIEVDKSADDLETIDSGSTFSTTNGVQYVSETTRTISSYVIAYKIDATTLVAGTYTFAVTTEDSESYTSTFTLASNSDADRITFFTSLKDFFDTALPDYTDRILIDESTGSTSFYVGFTESDGEYLVQGVDEVFTLTFGTLRIGNRYATSSTIATTKGYYPLAPYNVTSVTPTPTGYISATNLEDFFSGTDIETDAAFSARAEQQSDAPNSGTRPAILAALLELDGVSAASLYKTVNATTGLVEVEPIIFGGADTETIATALYESQPVNNQYTGQISYTVQTEDGSTETIQFTRGDDLNIYVRVLYKPQNGVSLSTTEQTDIEDALEDVNSVLSVGGTVFIGQLSGAVFETNSTRFSKLTVQVKDSEDGEYVSEDYIPESFELPVLDADRVEIVQVS